MIARGLDVDATDAVPAMVAKANEWFDVEATVMASDELSVCGAYDAVWAHACLLHCPRAALPGVLVAIYRSLRPNGWHFASYKLGTGEGRDLLGRLHNFPSADWLRDVYNAAHVAICDEWIYAGNSSDGTQRDWIDLTVRKA